MISTLSLLRLMSCWPVCFACAVSAFAQPSGRERPVTTASLNIAREYLPTMNDPYARVERPSNLRVYSGYARIVSDMLAGSPTFRRQCHRIAAASNLTVVVERNSLPVRPNASAWTTIKRDGHRIHAVVQMIAEGHEPELIAHELEHVIEYLDQVDLRAKGSVASTGVIGCNCGSTVYETARAVHVGKAVARELNGR